jgi:hypothetical protein
MFHLAGSTFVHWIADHNTVWRNPTTDEAARIALKYYQILAGSTSDAARGDSAMLETIWLVVGSVATLLCGSRAVSAMLGLREDDNESNGGYLFDGACTGEFGNFLGLILAREADVSQSCY